MIVNHILKCETHFDLVLINFNLVSILLHYAYHQISDYEIYTALTTT